VKIKLTGDVTGTRNGEEWPPRGTVIDLPDDEARQLTGSGLAVEAAKGTEAHAFGAGAPDFAALVNEQAARLNAVPPVESAAQDTKPTRR
jgi:hypothetical protein